MTTLKQGKALLLLLSFVVLFIGCQRDPDILPAPNAGAERLTPEEARAVFEQAALTTRSETGVLYSGEVTPYWPGARFSENSEVSSYDVEAVADIYFEQAQRLPDSTWVTAPLYPQVVVVSDRNGVKNPTAYLAFYFADWNSETFLEENPGEGMLNSLPKGTFSGRIIYTDLQGYPLAAARYRQGELADRAFLGDATDSLSLINESRRLNQLAEGLFVYKEEGTRANGWDIDGGWSNPVVVTPPKKPDIDWVNNPSIITDPTGGLYPNIGGNGGSGGGGSSSSTNDGASDGRYDNNGNIRVDSDIVHDMLDEIREDCMGAILVGSADGEIAITTDTDRNGAVRNSDGSFTIHFAEGKSGAQNRNFVLIEELIHVHQMQNAGNQFGSARLNYEIEAKLGWLMYLLRNSSTIITGSSMDYQLGIGGTEAFNSMRYICFPDMNTQDELSMNLYSEAVKSLRTIQGYKDENKYPEISSRRSFKTLKELMKNCLGL